MEICSWCPRDNALYKEYHNTQWGKPVYSDQKLFELLCLEGQQAGLSWLTILKKREAYCKSFDSFNIKTVALYDDKKVDELLQNKGIIRHPLKIRSIINNAKCVLDIQKEWGSFSSYIWHFTKGKIIKETFKEGAAPNQSDLSDTISRDLKKKGFSFVGPVIVYSYLEAIGVYNHHEKDCFLYEN